MLPADLSGMEPNLPDPTVTINAQNGKARVIRVGVIVTVAIVAIVIAVRLNDGYHSYASEQDAAFNTARIAAEAAISDFTDQNTLVTVNVVNNTGGTAYVYIGQIGQVQSVAIGVEAPATPNLVATLSPHTRTSLMVHDWLSKYITVTTQYIFLGSVRTAASALRDLTYIPQDGSESETAFVYAAANSSDSNFVDGTANDDVQPQQGGSEIAAAQDARVREYAQAHHVDRTTYPTDFESYLRSFFPAGK